MLGGMDLENPFKRFNNLEEDEEEDKGHTKWWARPESKGGSQGQGQPGQPEQRSGQQGATVVAKPLAVSCRIVRARTSKEYSGCSGGSA